MSLGLLFAVSFSQLSATVGAQGLSSGFSKNPKDVILNSFKLLGEQKSWTVETIVTNSMSPRVSKSVDRFLAPDRQHSLIIYDGQVLAEVIEVIMIGREAYTKFEGKWEKSNSDDLSQLLENLVKAIGYSDERYIANVAAAGRETVNGIETAVYQYDYDVKALMRDLNNKFPSKNPPPERYEEIKAKIWLNPATGLPVRFESVRKVEEFKGKITTIRKTTTYNFSEEIKIEAPKL